MHRPVTRAALAALLVLAGCAKEEAPRSFLQPNAIKKADLSGTWYYLQTVTDVPPTNGALFIGQSSELMKIKFDVQQNFLYARRAYEQIDGMEDAKAKDGDNYMGQILATWRIESHFDVIRDYNPTTGEETNRIIESGERPWYQREFIRVDWSQQLVTDFVGLGLSIFFDDGGTTIQPVSYWESDPTKPDALHLERADESDKVEFDSGEAIYLDVTNKAVVTPEQKTLCWTEGGQQQCFTVPACFLYYNTADCASQVVKIRHAFAKISPRHDYEPRMWDGKQMDQFGIWDIGLRRLSYNRQYGLTNSGAVRRAARFNIWQKSYNDDGSPIPYAERQIRTIPYYAGSSAPEGFPAELFDSGKEVIKQWNEALKGAVKAVTGKVPDQDIMVWCHNPVADGDPAACKSNLKPTVENGETVYRARQGDPRRSTIFWVHQFQAAGPLGYGPPMYDPVTGETISGQAYIYGGALDTYTTRSRDLVLLLTGKLSTHRFINGKDIQEYLASNRFGAADREHDHDHGSAGDRLHSHEELAEKAKAMDFKWARGAAPEAPIDTTSIKGFYESSKQRLEAMARAGLMGQARGDVAQMRRSKLLGTPLEAMMVTEDHVAAAGGTPGSSWDALDPMEKLKVSPLRSAAARRAIEQRFSYLTSLGVDYGEFADEGMVQRAVKLAQLLGTDWDANTEKVEEMRRMLRKDIFLGVTLHEVGHNMNMRHNFRGSYDALNYFPKYWELRSAGKQSQTRYTGIDPVTLKPTGVPYKGTNCNVDGLRPRWVDCPGGATSVEEIEGGVREYQYSSIMDYGSEFNSDFMGLGMYDKAAVKFAYAGQGYVEVFTKAKGDDQSQELWKALGQFRGALGYPSAMAPTDDFQAINYTTYPTLFEGNDWRNIYERADVPYTPNANGEMLFDSQGRPVVPYYFCGDEFAGNLTCQRFDSGADVYEQAQDIISRYNNFYLVNNFKRDRLTFHTSGSYLGRIEGRYLGVLRQQLTWYALLRGEYVDLLTDYLDYGVTDPDGEIRDFFAAENGWGSFTAAVTDGFDLLGQIIQRPQAGQHIKIRAEVSDEMSVDYWKQVRDDLYSRAPFAVIGLKDGRYTETKWDNETCGYYWAEECQSRIGYFLDKTVALDVMAQSQAYFTGRDTSTDVRKYAIGYYVPFKNQIHEKLGALLAGDMKSLAPHFDSDKRVVNAGWTLNGDGQTKTEIIDPAGGFTLQLYAGIYGLSAFPSTFDQTFIDTTRIFVVGNGEAPIRDASLVDEQGNAGPLATFDPTKTIAGGGNKEYFLWKDEGSGKVYAARSTGKVTDAPGRPQYRQDTGVRMLEMAGVMEQQRVEACKAPDSASCMAKTRAVERYRQNIAIMRSLHNAFGYGTYQTDAPFYF